MPSHASACSATMPPSSHDNCHHHYHCPPRHHHHQSQPPTVTTYFTPDLHLLYTCFTPPQPTQPPSARSDAATARSPHAIAAAATRPHSTPASDPSPPRVARSAGASARTCLVKCWSTTSQIPVKYSNIPVTCWSSTARGGRRRGRRRGGGRGGGPGGGRGRSRRGRGGWRRPPPGAVNE
jgi:hypothetical protein